VQRRRPTQQEGFLVAEEIDLQRLHGEPLHSTLQPAVTWSLELRRALKIPLTCYDLPQRRRHCCDADPRHFNVTSKFSTPLHSSSINFSTPKLAQITVYVCRSSAEQTLVKICSRILFYEYVKHNHFVSCCAFHSIAFNLVVACSNKKLSYRRENSALAMLFVVARLPLSLSLLLMNRRHRQLTAESLSYPVILWS